MTVVARRAPPSRDLGGKIADVDLQETADLGGIGPEPRPVDPHPDHRRTGIEAVHALDGNWSDYAAGAAPLITAGTARA